MVVKVNDWEFDIDVEKTKEHSSFALNRHCMCGYCLNYYCAIDDNYPHLRPFLEWFQTDIEGPSEMYPIEPTLCLIVHRIYGRVIKPGSGPIMVDGLPVLVEVVDDECFKLEIGEIPLPWVLEENRHEVISPANEPEFLERMYRKLQRRNSSSYYILS